MRLLRAVVVGLKPGRETLLPALLFWLAGLIPAWMGMAPLRSGFHAALDGSPVAAELSAGGGMDLLAELGMQQPGLWAAGFGLMMPALVFSLVVGLFIAAGTYARAASPEGSPWTRFWGQGARLFVPSGLVVLLNGLVWGVAAFLPGIVLAAVGAAKKEATDPGVPWSLFWSGVICALVVVGFFRAGAGFGRAWLAQAGGGTNPARAFLNGLKFSLRHLIPAQALTWSFLALRIVVVFAPVLWLSPGFATEGAVAGTLVLTQIGFLLSGYLKVAEVRSQVAYLGDLPPASSPAAIEPIPVVVSLSEPSVQEASSALPDPATETAGGIAAEPVREPEPDR